MNITAFLFLLSIFSVLTGLVTEAVKKFILDVDNRAYNIVALVVALILGFVGTLLYFYFAAIPITMVAFILAILMGLASALVAMVGYEKVKEAIEQLGK